MPVDPTLAVNVADWQIATIGSDLLGRDARVVEVAGPPTYLLGDGASLRAALEWETAVPFRTGLAAVARDLESEE